LTSRIDGRVALVTGAGRGLGRSHALTLASAGAAVVINDLGAELDGKGSDPVPAREVVSAITETGGRAVTDGSDVSSLDGGRRAVQAAVDGFGRVDIVVNNAGFSHGGGELEDPSQEELDMLFGVHYFGPLGVMSAALPHMRRNGYGRIVNTVTDVALDAREAYGFAYGAAKAALWSATLGIAKQVSGQGITVNAISPGARTRLTAEFIDRDFRGGVASGLDLSPEHVSRVVAYLCTEDAGDITGRVIHAVGGVIREYTTTRTSKSDLVDRFAVAIVS